MHKAILYILLIATVLYAAYQAVWIDLHVSERAYNKSVDNMFFEFLIGNGRGLETNIDNAFPHSDYKYICLYDIYGLDFLVDKDQFLLALERFQNRSYASSDLVWPIVLVGEGNYRIFYINYYGKPLGIEFGPHCFDLKNVTIEIESPGFDNGHGMYGTITVKSTQ